MSPIQSTFDDMITLREKPMDIAMIGFYASQQHSTEGTIIATAPICDFQMPTTISTFRNPPGIP
jgi:hypothetical protein